MGIRLKTLVVLVGILTIMVMTVAVPSHDNGNALSKSILFFEGQRSGKLPPSQRTTWRKDSALRDGLEIVVDLVGGYYDAGDNVKFNFPMAFSTTMLAWSVIQFAKSMEAELPHALDAIRWATDYFLKATSVPAFVFAQIGEPYGDHACWERPEDMDTPRTVYAVSKQFPGSEVSAEIAAALAASSIVFRSIDGGYLARLLNRARMNSEDLTKILEVFRAKPLNSQARLLSERKKRKKKQKMQQRKSASGRPSGTDGSDFSYRMVVDSRYQKVAKGKSRLYALIFVQGIIQIIGALYTFLWTSWEEGPNRVAISSVAIGFVSLLLGELGRRRSRVSLLKLYLVGSSIAIFLSIACVAKADLTLEDIKIPSNWQPKKFELIEASRVLLGFLIQIFAVSTVVSLIRNMSPPKKAS